MQCPKSRTSAAQLWLWKTIRYSRHLISTRYLWLSPRMRPCHSGPVGRDRSHGGERLLEPLSGRLAPWLLRLRSRGCARHYPVPLQSSVPSYAARSPSLSASRAEGRLVIPRDGGHRGGKPFRVQDVETATGFRARGKPGESFYRTAPNPVFQPAAEPRTLYHKARDSADECKYVSLS